MIKDTIYAAKRPFHFIKTGLIKGLTAQIKYRFPAKKIKIIAITGTDGKTSSSTLLYHVLKNSGKKVALLSTVAAYFEDEEITTGLHVTSPSPDQLHKLIKEMVQRKIEYLILEYTSHGAYQHRLWGINPIIAGVTNINNEHLDYHLNYKNYLEAKLILLKKTKTLVLNEDDMSFHRLKKKLPNKNHQFINYSYSEKLPRILHNAISKRFPEKFNQMNARLVTKISQKIGITNKNIAAGIENFPGVPGRMQYIENKRGIKIIIDFAHTPQGLEAALSALRQSMNKEKKHGRLIAVYGAAGLRDYAKRPVMGKIGVDIADYVILTSEDPRSENIWSIIRQMKEQLTEGHNKIITIIDRQEAINYAINILAKKGDYVGIFGKGPEKSMCFGKTETYWSETEAVQKAFKLSSKK